MKYLTKFIENEIKNLKQQNSNALSLRKLEIILKISEFIISNENYDDKIQVEGIYTIPNLNHGYSDIFLVSDSESDNPLLWKKIEISDEDLNLYTGDIIIKFR